MNNIFFYKAKRLDNGEWVEGSLVSTPKADEEFKAIIIPLDDNGGYTEGIDDECLGFEFWYKVDENTLCQCTGLKDKNGKLIWENDIVKVRYSDGQEEISQVLWDKYGYYPWANEYQCDGCVLYCEITDIEVIGNIFDNPEMLEVEE
jgi:uncharacterized phage protein (TIGR01671 family)